MRHFRGLSIGGIFKLTHYQTERLNEAIIALNKLLARVSAFERLLIVVFSILRHERADVEGLLEKVRERAGETDLSPEQTLGRP